MSKQFTEAPQVVLGIESSCDELAAAVVRDGCEVLSSVIRGQEAIHAAYGGVVPELASRDHVRGVSQVVGQTLEQARLSLGDVSGIAVTAGPGLLGSLLVGVSFGKALAYRAKVPVVGVHHLAGHLAAAELVCDGLFAPYLGLVVSGGHTALYRIEEDSSSILLGETLDDAVGEAFDKVAKLLGIPYPGGPGLASLATKGDPNSILLPRPLIDQSGFDFSYSGLKTAVLRAVQERSPLGEKARADIAASFEAAATDVLVSRACRAVKAEGIGRVAVVGGVAANTRLRSEFGHAAKRECFKFFVPPVELCTDNAVMIAAAGTRLLRLGGGDDMDLSAFSKVSLGKSPWRKSPIR